MLRSILGDEADFGDQPGLAKIRLHLALREAARSMVRSAARSPMILTL
jgi:hypothetical protein